MHGDCSIRVGGGNLGFTAQEIEQCVQREGLLAIELDLAAHGLSLAEIGNVLDQAAALGARRCVLAHDEKAVHPELRGIVKSARDRRMEIELLISMQAMDNDLAGFLRENSISVIVEYESGGEERLEELKSQCGERLAAAISVSHENIETIPGLWRWARSKSIEPRVQIITPHSSGATLVNPDDAKALFEELGRIDREEFNIRWDIPPSLIGRSCKRHLFACHVTSGGDVFACVGVTIPLGNIRTESLKEILELSEVMENLRDFHHKVKEPCASCCQSVDCYGCRGAAFQLTGDYLTGDPLCWKAKGIQVESLPADVAGLIPHGKTIRLAEQIVQIGERTARTTFKVNPDCNLLDETGSLDETAYIEMIAQSFAACHGFHLTPQQRRTHRGLLLGVKDLLVHGRAKVGDRLEIEVNKITRFGPFGVVEGKIFRQDGKLLATGQVKVWRQDET